MKILKLRSILFLLFLPIPSITSGQDILYKKDSTLLKVTIVDLTGKTIKYKSAGDPAGTYHLISTSLLDSINYNGNKAIVFMNALNNKPLKRMDRNYLSTELFNLFTGKANLDYERISKTGKTAFVAGFLFNFNTYDDKYWYGRGGSMLYYNFSPHYFFIRTGITFYPFSHSLARSGYTRVSTGFSLLTGSYRKVDYSIYNENGYGTNPALAASLMWAIEEKIFLGDHFMLTGGLEISVLPLFRFFCPQIGISLGF